MTDKDITIYPAIDLKDGKCVRLYKGSMQEVSVYNDNPAAQAQAFVCAGAKWLHIVDLNGAFKGEPVNHASVEVILRNIEVPVQLGGGIRDLATMERWLGAGITRLILGTLALNNPALVKEACKLFPGRIAVGIDARAGYVAVEGWDKVSKLTTLDMAGRFEDAGVAALIHTDIDRDGTLSGVNAEASAEIARAISIPVIASGGVRDVADIIAVRETNVLEGVITGKALYGGSLTMEQALKAAGKTPC